MSTRTVDLLVEYGFAYDSSMMGNDFSPYWCRSGDVATSDGPYVLGEPVDLVEIPVAWHLNDITFFDFVPGVPNLAGVVMPGDVVDIWKREFSFLYEQLGRGSMTVTMHPQSIGRGHRLPILAEFIEFVLGHRGARFATAGEIADEYRAENESPGT